MSWTVLSSNKRIKVRKPHRCDICNTVIPKGGEAITRSGVEHGEGYHRMYLHPECEEHSSKWDYDDWECHCPGDISFEEVKRSLKANQEGRR